MTTLETELARLPGIGPAIIKKLKRLGLTTVRELLFYFPSRYEDFSRFIPIAEAKIGSTIAVQGIIRELKERRSLRRRLNVTEGLVEDATGGIRSVWFSQPWMFRILRKGMRLALAGKVYEDRNGAYLASPAYEILGKEEDAPPPPKDLIHTGRLVPVYPETAGLTSRWFRVRIRKLLALTQRLEDPLPPATRKRQGLVRLSQAVATLHFPRSPEEVKSARRRLAFQDILTLQLIFLRRRKQTREEPSMPIPFDRVLASSFVERLPFKLTDDQRRVAWQILQDLQKPHPMQRLLEGDVGSGKTVVALLAILQTTRAGAQAALMAPTEILARQHFRTAEKFLSPLGVRTALLVAGGGSVHDDERRKTRKTILKGLAGGEVDFVIGTHALIQKQVCFKRLALAIIDEQHRFGVAQRASLRNIAGELPHTPHLLSMSATPIPRTLALAVYGDLDISRLTEMPPGRKAVITKIVAPEERDETYRFMGDEIRKGRQAYVICPRITTEEELAAVHRVRLPRSNPWNNVKAVTEEHRKLSKEIFPGLRVAMLHGKMVSRDKERVMRDFADAKIDILVSTSVVEVGVDVPNATLMAIEGADRFGLATLHQFRGRVGRGEHQSSCLLFTDSAGQEHNARLRALVNAKNGFELAEHDLRLRGPGEFLGEEQSGMPDIAMNALRDPDIVEAARKEARLLLAQDQDLDAFPQLRRYLAELEEKLHGE